MNNLMKTIAVVLLLFAKADAGESVTLQEGVTVRPATVAEGQAILQADDRFTTRLSRFDLESRIGKADVTRKDFNEMVRSQVQAWPDEQWVKVQAALVTVSQWLRDRELAPPLPREILVVYTTGKEEGNAAYCRGASVVLPASLVEKARPQRLNNLMAHELFHILSANHPRLQAELYGDIGFKKLPREIQLPDSLKNRKITNPDGPGLNHYIQLKDGDQSVAAVPLLFANADRFDPKRGGSFFTYLQFQLLVIEQIGDQWRVAQKDGKPLMLAPETNDSFFDQIGRNTKYIYHPDEILADNFVFLLQDKRGLESPQVIEQMRETIESVEK